MEEWSWYLLLIETSRREVSALTAVNRIGTIWKNEATSPFTTEDTDIVTPVSI